MGGACMEACMVVCTKEVGQIAVAMKLVEWDQGAVVAQEELDAAQAMTLKVSCRMLAQEATTSKRPRTGT